MLAVEVAYMINGEVRLCTIKVLTIFLLFLSWIWIELKSGMNVYYICTHPMLIQLYESNVLSRVLHSAMSSHSANGSCQRLKVGIFRLKVLQRTENLISFPVKVHFWPYEISLLIAWFLPNFPVSFSILRLIYKFHLLLFIVQSGNTLRKPQYELGSVYSKLESVFLYSWVFGETDYHDNGKYIVTVSIPQDLVLYPLSRIVMF